MEASSIGQLLLLHIVENGLDRGHGHHTVTWYAQLSERCAETEMESGLGLETFKKTTA